MIDLKLFGTLFLSHFQMSFDSWSLSSSHNFKILKVLSLLRVCILLGPILDQILERTFSSGYREEADAPPHTVSP